MAQEITTGKIINFNQDGTVLISAVVPDMEKATRRKYSNVLIGFEDGRRISSKQRRKCYALIGEIAEYIEGYRTAETINETKEMLKLKFTLECMQSIERRMFSLSDVPMETATDFITFLVNFIIRHGVPTKISIIDNCEDIGAYVYACLIHKKCACCGRPCDLHHVDTVAAHGGNREKINHLGLRALPLCREHHTDLHKMGDTDFMQKWHLEPVKIDEKIAKIYRLNTK